MSFGPKWCSMRIPGTAFLWVAGKSARSRGRESVRQRKGREAGQFQERDRVCNLLAHYPQDQQAKKPIHARLGMPPVQPKGRTGIGTRWKQAPFSRDIENGRPKECVADTSAIWVGVSIYAPSCCDREVPGGTGKRRPRRPPHIPPKIPGRSPNNTKPNRKPLISSMRVVAVIYACIRKASLSWPEVEKDRISWRKFTAEITKLIRP